MEDPNSYANSHECVTTHLVLDWCVDFEEKKLKGHVALTLKATSACSRVILDTRDLSITDCQFRLQKGSTSWQPVHEWHLDPSTHVAFGQALIVPLPSVVPAASVFELDIKYSTQPSSSACQWLDPSQTMTKKHPYLFTQCQAIHARSLLPCQDSPAVKSTYAASIHVPKTLRALMSALRLAEQGAASSYGDSFQVFEFEQKVPIPSYLIALAVGALKGIRIGPRTTIWSEEGMVQKGAFEFEETEQFIATAESLISKYAWGIYDLLLLPPSFPYGGMENPCLTFVTPTLLAGDRSLVDVVAHEISHSWAGNLATNRNWQHFWLNEGWCVYIERKILQKLHGEDARQFHAILGWKALQESIEHFGQQNPLTCLVPNLKDTDPDDAFSSVPYEKGFNLLYYLETLLGANTFETFMRSYYQNFTHQSLTTDEWKSFLYDFIKLNHPEKVKSLDQVDWHRWLHEPGMPPVPMPFDTRPAEVCYALSKRWDAARDYDSAHLKQEFPASEWTQLTAGQQVVFLEKLGETKALPLLALHTMADTYGLKAVGNSEIRFRWYQLCIKAADTSIFDDVVGFLIEQGRMKFVRPLYRSLFQCGPEGRQLAVETFKKYSTFYHPIAAQMVGKDLQLDSGKK